MNNSENNTAGSQKSSQQQTNDVFNIEVQRPSHEEIATMAYYIWLSEGCPEGCAERHWFEAEAQLIRTRQAEAMEKLKEQMKTQPADELISASVEVATARSDVAEQKPTQQCQESNSLEKKKKRRTVSRARSSKTTRPDASQSI